MLALTPGSLTRPDAIRFLQRATLGARPGEDTALIDLGVDAWLTDQFARPPAQTNVERLGSAKTMYRSFWQGAFEGTDQLRKRVAYALSQIFVVSASDVGSRKTAIYADLLEEHAFGTYRDLLEHITLSQAMGDYLTYRGNRKADERKGSVPDENYAREIMQLFSIGLWELNDDGSRRLVGGEPIPTYDNDDIIGLARVFTGWNRPDNPDGSGDSSSPMVNREDWHEPGAKTFLGVTVPENTDGVESLRIALDTIAAHRNVAPFISHQLIQRLVTSNPSPAYLRRVSRVFADDGNGQRGNLAAVVRAILIDDEAWQNNPPDWFGKLREPALRFTVLMRALDVGTPNGHWRFDSLDEPSTELSQQPYRSPSVFNFYRPGYVPPQTALGDAGRVAPELQLANEPSVIGWLNFIGRELRRDESSIVYDIDDLRALVDDPAALVAEMAMRLCPNGISDELRSIVERTVESVEFSNQDRRTQERVMSAALLIAASTDFLYER